MSKNERDVIIPPPGIATADFLCSGADALAMLPPDAGYVLVKDFEEELFKAGYSRTARELSQEIRGWCHICDTPQHRCPTSIHLKWSPADGTPPFIIAQRCKRSACEHCGPIYVARWRQHIEDDLEFWLSLPSRFQVYWFTQTFDPATHPLPFADADAHKAVTRLLADLIRSLRNRYGNCEYVTVIEPHKSGQIHVHAFLAMMGPADSADPVLRSRCTAQHRGGYNRHHPPAERLPEGSCVCTLTGNREPCIGHIAAGLGYGINNLQRLTTASAASKYVTKRLGSYITKTVSAYDRPRYARALRMSRHFSVETHGAFLSRIADRYRNTLGEPDRGQGAWERLSEYAGYMYAGDETGRISPRSIVGAAHRRYLYSLRPEPPPPVYADQIAL